MSFRVRRTLGRKAVIPAQAGIQGEAVLPAHAGIQNEARSAWAPDALDSRLRGTDDRAASTTPHQ
jgi:hypothetical protein